MGENKDLLKTKQQVEQTEKKDEKLDSIEVKDQIERIKNDMLGLAALIHMTFACIRTDSVGPDEIEHAVYSLVDMSVDLSIKVLNLYDEIVDE